MVLGVGPQAIEGGGGGFSKADRGDLVKALRKIKDTLYRDKIVWKATVISTAKAGGGGGGASCTRRSVGPMSRKRRLAGFKTVFKQLNASLTRKKIKEIKEIKNKKMKIYKELILLVY